MAEFNVGLFKAEVWEAYPVQITLSCDGQDNIRFSHKDLSDLRYLLSRVDVDARKKLGDDAGEV